MDNIDDDVEVKVKKIRGRPLGFKLSEKSKDRIRKSRFGVHHSKKTKDKISKSLVKYFREKDPLSESIRNEYENFPQYIDKWIVSNEGEINQTDCIMTEKKMLFLRQLEICLGFEIAEFGHNATPEFFIMLKEELMEKGLTEELEVLYSLL
jgi:hypothetical protein